MAKVSRAAPGIRRSAAARGRTQKARAAHNRTVGLMGRALQLLPFTETQLHKAFLALIFAAILLQVNLRWLVKDSLYNTPFRPILKWSGAIPIDRSGGQNVVEQAAQILRSGDDIHLALAPEGTRKRTDGWKSGFYYIALRAKAPIYFGFIDYKLRECGIGGHMELTGDIEADMKVIKAFYETKTPKFPENYGEIKLAARRSPQPKSEPQTE